LPEFVQVLPGHGAGSACGKSLGAVPTSVLGYERRFNQALIRANQNADEFVRDILSGQPEPPLYFARMKRDNKLGPKVLGSLPQPKMLAPGDVASLANSKDYVVIDTRTREEYYAGHIAGSLSSTLNKQFNTIAGSYAIDEDKIVLVVDAQRVKEAVTDLVRVGIDQIVAYVTPDDLNTFVANGGQLATLSTVKFDAMPTYEGNDDYLVLDVRKATEFALGAVPGAKNIAHTRLRPRLNEIPKDKTIVVHCQAGGRSAVAAAYLKREGFDVVLIDDTFDNYKVGAGATV
jgi:hydroxyacylglutathione hydrolase